MSKPTHYMVKTNRLSIMMGDRTPFGTVAGYTTEPRTQELLLIFSDPYSVVALDDLFYSDDLITVLRPV